jgi:zinc and cadmium transporter
MVGRGGWIGAFAGLGLHSALEGIAIAAAIELGAREGHGALAGFATVLVVLLHKPFDAMTLSTMLAAAGASAARRHVMNAVFAAIVPLGAVAFALGVRGDGAGILGLALAFSAGTFLCIAAADLLPELQFHSHDRLGLTAALVAGLGIAWGIGRLEAATHSHEHGGACTDPSHDHSHDHDHDHDHGHDHGDAPGH